MHFPDFRVGAGRKMSVQSSLEMGLMVMLGPTSVGWKSGWDMDANVALPHDV